MFYSQKKISSLILLSLFLLSVFFTFKCTIKPICSETTDLLPYQLHCKLTGKNALNDTRIVDVNGTDLGIIVKHGSTYRYIFGDTFGVGGMGSNWRSNTMAYSVDQNASDGIMLKGWVTSALSGHAKELISSKKEDYVEITCIPTTALSYDDKLFIYYMSVKHWSTIGGIWSCNNASIAVSMDNGFTFTKISNISWAGTSHFIQFGVAQDNRPIANSYYYFLATPSGRFGACYLCRVLKSNLLNQLSYEYYSGKDESDSPIWENDYTLAEIVIPANVGELSVMWDEYLGKWIVFYTDNFNLALMVRTADNLWGPWSTPRRIIDSTVAPGLYGSFIHPDLVENEGEVVYFVMSIWSLYNTFVMSVNLSSLKSTPTAPFSVFESIIQTAIGISSSLIILSILKTKRKDRLK